MKKRERIERFHQLMADQTPASSPQDAWSRMTQVLADVESAHAPEGEQPMTILPLTHADVRSYGDGGFAVPLIGYMVFFNANGALAVRDDWAGRVISLTLPGSNGVAFIAVPHWKYSFH